MKKTDTFKKYGVLQQRGLFGRKPGSRDLYVFFVQLAAFYRAGISFSDALRRMAEQTGNKTMRAAMVAMRQFMDEDGLNLADAMERSRIFPDYALHSVRAGERSGILDQVFAEVAVAVKQENEIRRKINSALLPIKIICGIIAMAMLVIFYLVVPKFKTLYDSMHVELPFISRFVFAVVGVAIDYWYIFAALLAVLYFVWRVAKVKYAYQLDGLMFSIPIYSRLYYYRIQYRLAATMQMLLHSGLPAAEVLYRLGQVPANLVVQKALERAAHLVVNEGYNLSDAMTASNKRKLLDFILLAFLRTGESSGSTSELLGDAAVFYRETLVNEVENFANKITPVFLIPVTVVILLTMVSIYAPLFTIMQNRK